MQETTMCFSNQEKPGKDEKCFYMPKYINLKNCPDCDKKRSTACKDSNCGRQKR